MMRPLPRFVAAVLIALAALAAPLAVAAPSSADDTFVPSGPGGSCSSLRVTMSRTPHDISRVGQGVVTLSGYDINFRSSRWALEVPTNALVMQNFHSAVWLHPILKTDPGLAVSLLLEQARMRPDVPGLSSREFARNGWVESHVTKRMWTVMCVLDVTRDARLVPVLESLVNANLDPNRYYGPPLRAAHNHGVFANEALRAAGIYLGRPEWVETAAERLEILARLAFEPCGMTIEQSATYHLLNVRIWQRNLARLPSLDSDEILQKPRRALAALARPDGLVETIGDGYWGAFDRSSLTQLGVSPGGSVWCPTTGWWAQHRPIDGGVSHVVARFGPRTALHGHNDRTSITWWVGTSSGDGVAVLSERGMYSKERDARDAFVQSDAAHTVLSRIDAPFTAATTGMRLRNPGMSTAQFTTTQPDGVYRRVLSYSGRHPVLGVSDTVTASRAGSGFRQYWQLAPSWVPDTQHTARTADGRTLDVLCFVDGRRQRVTLTRVWSFPGVGKEEPAYTASCATSARTSVRVDTLLVLDSPVGVVPPSSPTPGRSPLPRVVTRYGTFSVTAAGLWTAPPPGTG